MVERLGEFEVGEEIGRGGMAVVYRGHDARLGRSVALKVLHPYLAHEEESRRRFEREARAVAQLRHPNIIEIYAFGGGAGEPTYIASELVEGPDLKQFLRDNPIDLPSLAVLLALPVARALDHAHAHGVIHRDIKPENVLIQRGGIPKLTDFGIAHLIDEQMTTTGTILGSPAYMSPEHLREGTLDPRADVFSFGTLLYVLATGVLPFQAETPHGIVQQILESDPPDPRTRNPIVDDELAGIISRAMARNIDERYLNVRELVVALTSYLASHGIREPDAALRIYLDNPPSYAAALRETTAERLEARARRLSSRGRLADALKTYNRLLALREGDDLRLPSIMREVRAITVRRNRRRGFKLFGAAASLLLVLAGVGWVIGAQLTRGCRPEIDAPLMVYENDEEPPGVPPFSRREPIGPEQLTGAKPRLGPEEVPGPPDEPEVPREGFREPRVRRPRRPPPREVIPSEPEKAELIPVVIQAFPPAVEIRVNEVFRGVGKTPLLELPPGVHQVHLRHPACEVCLETRETFVLDALRPPSKPLDFRIRYKPSRLTVRSKLEADVVLDGRAVGVTNEEIELPMLDGIERNVLVLVTHPGYRPWRMRVRLRSGAETSVVAVMRPSPQAPW